MENSMEGTQKTKNRVANDPASHSCHMQWNTTQSSKKNETMPSVTHRWTLGLSN